MTAPKSGYDTLKETMKTLTHPEVAVETPPFVDTGKEAMNKAITNIEQNQELMQLYQDNALIGGENLAGSMPMLKIHSPGKSINNILLDGNAPHDGWFYHTKLRKEYEAPLVHILTVSRGFRTEILEKDRMPGGQKDRFNQLVGGVLVDELAPFVMWFNGLKWNSLKLFAQEANQFTHAKPIPTPIFALTVRLTGRKVKHNKGESPIADFEILRTPSGEPERVLDPGKFVFLRDLVLQLEEAIEVLITNKQLEEETVQ